MFKFVDLFCGMGGFHHALESLGGTCVFASDIDKHCQESYETAFGMKPVGDIRSVLPEDVPDHDVLCGGFPCQPFSNAGHRNALEDTRGTLFQDIANIVRAKKPKVLLLENVKHIRSIQNGHVYRTIYSVFESLGYNMKDIVLSPDAFGVPQNRERVYFMAVRNDIGTIELPDLTTIVKTQVPILEDTVDKKWNISNELKTVFSAWDEMIPVLAGQRLGVPIILDYFREEETPDMKDWKKTYIRKNRALYESNKDAWDAWTTKHKSVLDKKAVYRKLEWQAGVMKPTDTVLKGHFIQLRQSGMRIKNATTYPTLVAIVQTSIVGDRARYLTPRECARLQSFPESHVLHPSERVAYKQLGNSVNVNVVEFVARHVLRVAALHPVE